MTADKLAFVFPGQGSQAVGMTAELAAAYPEVRQTFDEASEGAGLDLWRLSQDGPEDQLNRTEFTQPALLAASVATWKAWCAAGGAMPALLAGHSLGEYSALVAARTLSLGDAAKLVRERGRLMQAAVAEGAGAMAAVIGAEDDLVLEVCKQASGERIVAPANFNSPGQIVIGGDAEAVDRALELLAERGVRKVVRLAVSVPSHTSLMRGAANRLAEAMSAVAWNEPSVPLVQNVDAQVHDSLQAIRDALVRQLYLPVRWTGCVQALAVAGATHMVECGPGKVLAGLVKRIDRSIQIHSIGTLEALQTAVAARPG